MTAPGEPAHDAVLRRFGAPVDGAGRDAGPRGARRGSCSRTRRRCATWRRSSTPRSGRGSSRRSRPPRRPARRPWSIEAIKLVEGGLAALCDEVWLVTCDPAAQRARLAGRGMAAGRRRAADRRPGRPGRAARARRRRGRRRRRATAGATEALVAAAYAAALGVHGAGRPDRSSAGVGDGRRPADGDGAGRRRRDGDGERGRREGPARVALRDRQAVARRRSRSSSCRASRCRPSRVSWSGRRAKLKAAAPAGLEVADLLGDRDRGPRT